MVPLTAVWTLVVDNSVAIAIGLIGIAATVVVYLLTRRVKRPRWSVHTVDLVTKRTAQLQGLSVTFKGKPVSDLSVSRVVLFNAGLEPIRREDIAPAAPLALEVPTDVQMLDATLVKANNKVNRMGVRFDPSSNRALVEFDFLSAKDGGVFDVVHYGGGQPTAIVAGVVIGAMLRQVSVPKPDPIGKVLAWLAGAVSIAGAYYLVQQIATKGFDWGEPIIFAGFVALPGGLFLSQFAQHSVPKGLEAFHERGYRTQPIGKGASSAGPT
jgi:hypothetical protein